MTNGSKKRSLLLRYTLSIPLTLGLMFAANHAHAQSNPTPPPPPPTPGEVINKINPFKKRSTKTEKKAESNQDRPAAPAGAPAPPPSPGEVLDKINPFKKHKKTSTITPPPPAPEKA